MNSIFELIVFWKEMDRKFEKNLNKGDFRFLKIIGESDYGVVWKVKNKETGDLFAIK